MSSTYPESRDAWSDGAILPSMPYGDNPAKKAMKAIQGIYRGLKVRLVPRMSSLQQAVAQQSAWLLGVNVVSRILGIVRGVIVARLLSPDDYGVLAILLIAAFYLQSLDLGVGFGTLREIPLLEGRKRAAEIVRLQRQVVGWEIFVGLLTGVGISTYVLVVAPPGSEAHLAAWLTLPVYTCAELLRNTLQSYLQAREEFERLRRSMVWHASLDVFLAVVLTPVWGLPGAAAAMALTSLAVVGYLIWDSRITRPYIPARIAWPTFRSLVGVGFPMMVQNVMWANLTNVDKLVILSFLDRESLAYYVVAQTIAGSMLLVPGAITRVNGPLMIRRLAETSDPAALYGMVYRTVLVLAYGLPVLVASVWLFGPAFLSFVLPRYIGAVPLLDVTSVSMYAIGITFGASSLYVALNRQVLQGFMLLGVITCTIAISLLLLALGWQVMGVAVASASASCLYLIVFLATGFRMLGGTGRSIVRDVGLVLLPLFLCVVFVLVLALGPEAFGISRSWLAGSIFLATMALASGAVKSSLRGQEL